LRVLSINLRAARFSFDDVLSLLRFMVVNRYGRESFFGYFRPSMAPIGTGMMLAVVSKFKPPQS
jgi:hypothetical protein